jgi:endonuclease-8
MPEGPEIRRAADRIAEAIVGRRATRVRLLLPRLRGREAELEGRVVESVEPRGKALLTAFEGGRYLYSHNQLYGRWYVCRPGRPPRTSRSLRVAIETEERWALLYSASEIEVLGEEELATQPFLARIGPDVLAPDTTPRRIRALLRDRRFRGRALGGLLLDQGFVAGLGNYLRSEILFFAGLRPEVRPADLDEDRLALLARTIREVTRRSYRTGGLTEERALVERARRAGEPRRFHRHAVFARAGKRCRRCASVVRKLEVGGRRLYLCPSCQPATPRPVLG